MKLIFLGALVLMLVACSHSVDLQRAAVGKVIYTNAHIYTVAKGEGTWAEAMVSANGKLVYVGSADGALDYQDDRTQLIDLKGAFVMPGMIDTHTHPGLVGALQLDDDTDVKNQRLPVESKEALYDFLQSYADDNFWKLFVMLGEWDVMSFLPEGPNKKDLDKIFKYKPVVLMDNSGHSMWLNSSAMWLFGIDSDTPDVSPGISHFVRDEYGEPTGWVKEFALFPYVGDALFPDDDTLKRGIEDFLQTLSRQGVTTLWDAGNFSEHDKVYKLVAELEQEGRLPLRYFGSYHIWDPKQIDIAIAEIKRLQSTYGGERLLFDTIKIHFDGVNEIMTAGLLEPYATDPNVRGGVLFSAQRLAEFIVELNQEGLNLHLHTVGDWATREALDAVELARQQEGSLGIEVSLSHLEVTDPADIPRFKELNVHANFTPHWFGGTHFGEAGYHNLGSERSARGQNANAFVQTGANVTLSSDVVTEAESYRANPFIGLQMSVTRREYNDASAKVLSPASARLTLTDAVAAYTHNGAKQMGLDHQLGSLQAGKLADFVVLDENPFEIDVNQLHTIVPRAVVVGGYVENGLLERP